MLQSSGEPEGPASVSAVIRRCLGSRPGRRILEAVTLIGGTLATLGCGPSETPVESEARQENTSPTFIGRQACVPCHRTESRLWEGSHHDRAMQEVSEQTVLGDFDDADFTYSGVTSTFFRRDGGFFVRTDGPDGDPHEYEIAYTFGVFPLQQYLIAFPGGRFQALSICWDTRPASEGGQRWFHLYPGEAVDHEDPLHWTGIHQNWNYMCAECHSTQLRKNFDLAADRFDTTWEEIDVSCEACHGPGSQHVAWAEAAALGDGSRYDDGHLGLTVRLEDPGRGTWLVSPETGSGMRLAPPVETAELDTCARCHSRRSLISEDYRFGRPILDTHRVAFLTEGLYHADGQILEEVYVHGSYLQSRMHAKGVTCSDCHDPHSAELHFPGDAVCYRCHSQVAFATEKHHFHKPGTSGAFCVDCHMPPKTYMVVDPRHDHSLRVPRPDLSLELGTPNACNDCHRDKPVQWSVDWIVRWYGSERRREWRYGQALHAGREQLPSAERELTRLIRDEEAPAIARATALELLTNVLTPASVATVEQALGAADPLLRIGALQSLAALPAQERVRLALPLLSDPVRAVRLDATSALIDVPDESMSREQRNLFMSGVEEYRSAQMAVAERAEAHLNLGWLEASLGNLEAAERAYRTALGRDPEFVPAYVNLADLYRLEGREAEGERVLREALARAPEVAELHYSLGLLLVRRRQVDRALASLARASELAPAESRFQYVYAVALHDSGDRQTALQVLETTHERFPSNREVLMGLISFHREGGSLDRAAELARRLLALDPTNPDLQKLVAELERQTP